MSWGGCLQVRGAAEQREADPLAMPRPKRRERFPTDYKAPSAVLTPDERELLMGSGASSQPSAADSERPAGLMQPPRATINLEQPPNSMQPPRPPPATNRPMGLIEAQPPQAHVTLRHGFPTGSPTSSGCATCAF